MEPDPNDFLPLNSVLVGVAFFTFFVIVLLVGNQ